MPIKTPAFLESPSTLLSSRIGGAAQPRHAKRAGAADQFSSILNAQKPRVSLAESAREAQEAPVARDQAEKAKRDDDTEAATSADESQDAEDRAGDATGQASNADDGERAEESQHESSGPSHHATQTGADQPIMAVPAAGAQQSADDAAEASSRSAPKPSNGAHTATSQPVHTAAVSEESKAADPKPQPAVDRSEKPGAAQVVKLQRQAHEHQSPRAERVAKSEVPPVDADQAAPRRTSATSHADPEVKPPEPSVRHAEAARETVRNAAHDAFRQSSEQPARPELEPSGPKRTRSSHQVNHATNERLPSPAGDATAPRESEMQKATRDAIDKLLNERAPREIEAKSGHKPAAPTSQTNSSIDAPARPQSAPAVATTSPVPSAESAQPSLSATMTTTTASAVGTTSLAGESAGQSANASTPTSGSEWMTRSDHAAGRILRGLSAMINQHGGSMTMRLDPPELGSLRIQMMLSNGSVSAAFTPSSAAARSLLEQNMAQLKTALESQGLMVDKLSINSASTQQTNTQAGHQHGADQRSGNEQQHTDAGQGESRGRREQDGEQRGNAAQFFDPAMLFDMNDEHTFAPAQFGAALEERIPA